MVELESAEWSSAEPQYIDQFIRDDGVYVGDVNLGVAFY